MFGQPQLIPPTIFLGLKLSQGAKCGQCNCNLVVGGSDFLHICIVWWPQETPLHLYPQPQLIPPTIFLALKLF